MKTKNIIILFVLYAAAILQAVDMSSMFLTLGSEMHTQTDSAGRIATYWTSGDYSEYTAASGSDVWIDNGRYIIFESVRPRPVGGTTAGERQLVAADTQTGSLYWMRALTRESTSTYGAAHIEMPAAVHYDCCEAANLVAFRDITGHRLYCLNLNTGAVNEIWTLTDGTFYGAPTIAADGSWVMINAVVKGPNQGGDFAGTTSAVCRIAINPLTGAKVSNPVSLYDGVSLIKGGIINTFLGAAINKFTGNVIAYNVVGSNYAAMEVTGLRYIENDASLMSVIANFTEQQSIKNLFWAGGSNYVYYIDASDAVNRQYSLARMHTLTRRHQKWTPTLAAKQIRLSPIQKQSSVVSLLQKLEISCFEMSADETLAAYSVPGRGIYYINTAEGKAYQVLTLSSGEDVENIAFDRQNGKMAFVKRSGSNSKIGSSGI